MIAKKSFFFFWSSARRYEPPTDQLPGYPNDTKDGSGLQRRNTMNDAREKLLREKREREARAQKEAEMRQRPATHPGMIKFRCPNCQVPPPASGHTIEHGHSRGD